jgi:hypothetical protein
MLVGIYSLFEKQGPCAFVDMHCTPDSNFFMQRKFMNCMGTFATPISVILSTFPFNEIMPPWKGITKEHSV